MQRVNTPSLPHKSRLFKRKCPVCDAVRKKKMFRQEFAEIA